MTETSYTTERVTCCNFTVYILSLSLFSLSLKEISTHYGKVWRGKKHEQSEEQTGCSSFILSNPLYLEVKLKRSRLEMLLIIIPDCIGQLYAVSTVGHGWGRNSVCKLWWILQRTVWVLILPFSFLSLPKNLTNVEVRLQHVLLLVFFDFFLLFLSFLFLIRSMGLINRLTKPGTDLFVSLLLLLAHVMWSFKNGICSK